MSESVIQVFIDLYNKGLIYRGIRMVNWDPSAKATHYLMKKSFTRKLIQNYFLFLTIFKIQMKK